MFAGAQQSGFISIFYSVGSNPLALWDKQVKNGHIRRVIDDEVKSLVLDIGGTNVATTYITCPIKPRASLGVKLPFFVMVIKNMKKYFSFEIQILDDKDMRRRFRVSNFQSTTKVRPFCTTMPIGLSSGWNQVQFNLADFTKRAYGSMYVETVRVQIHANVRIRRIYFTDQLHSDDDLPNEFKLFAPGARDQKSKGKDKKPSKEAIDAAAAAAEAVPPIKTEPRPDEEVPPPPSPAEESPTVKEEEPAEVSEAVEVPPEVEGGVPAEVGDESPATEGVVEGEAPPPADEGEPEIKQEEGEGEAAISEPPPEGAEPALEPDEGVATEEMTAAGPMGEVGQEEPKEEPVEEDQGGEQMEPAVAEDVGAEVPTEGGEAEGTVEVSETVEETTEVTTTEATTEVTDSEVAPSAGVTTDEGDEA